ALSGGSSDLLPDAQPLACCRQAADRRGVGTAYGLDGCDARPPAPRARSPPWCGALGPGEIQEPSRGRSGQPPSASREIWVALFVPRLHSDIVLLRRWSP